MPYAQLGEVSPVGRDVSVGIYDRAEPPLVDTSKKVVAVKASREQVVAFAAQLLSTLSDARYQPDEFWLVVEDGR